MVFPLFSFSRGCVLSPGHTSFSDRLFLHTMDIPFSPLSDLNHSSSRGVLLFPGCGVFSEGTPVSSWDSAGLFFPPARLLFLIEPRWYLFFFPFGETRFPPFRKQTPATLSPAATFLLPASSGRTLLKCWCPLFCCACFLCAVDGTVLPPPFLDSAVSVFPTLGGGLLSFFFLARDARADMFAMLTGVARGFFLAPRGTVSFGEACAPLFFSGCAFSDELVVLLRGLISLGAAFPGSPAFAVFSFPLEVLWVRLFFPGYRWQGFLSVCTRVVSFSPLLMNVARACTRPCFPSLVLGGGLVETVLRVFPRAGHLSFFSSDTAGFFVFLRLGQMRVFFKRPPPFFWMPGTAARSPFLLRPRDLFLSLRGQRFLFCTSKRRTTGPFFFFFHPDRQLPFSWQVDRLAARSYFRRF